MPRRSTPRKYMGRPPITIADKLQSQPVKKIISAVKKNPGIHFHAICRELAGEKGRGYSRGSMSRNVNLLENENILKCVSDGYRKHYYLEGQEVRKGLSERFLDEIEYFYHKNGKGITKTELGARLDLTERVVRYNLTKLSEKLIVEKVGRWKLYLPRYSSV